MGSLMIFSLFIIMTFFESGYSQYSNDKFNVCELSYLLYPVFGGEDQNLHYKLFTRNNSKDACDLQPTERALQKCKFNPSAKTKVIVHGWITSSGPNSLDFELKDKLLQADNYNVVLFNWIAYANTYDYSDSDGFNYFIAAIRSFFVGLKLASWMHFLKVHGGADLSNFHMIGHSLGAEVVSYAGKTTCTVGQITYLDAASTLFKHLPEFLQPSNTDAAFVEEIHTDGSHDMVQGFGYVQPIAVIDYYPNGGKMQPNCFYGANITSENGEKATVYSKSKLKTCNHESSYIFYLASFNESCKFLGLICDSYEDYTSGKCSSGNAHVCRMGFYTKKLPGLPVHSKCYLKTSAMPPYCLN